MYTILAAFEFKIMTMLKHAIILFSGEFGIVYKAQLINWQGRRLPLPVAVKTLKGDTNNIILAI